MSLVGYERPLPHCSAMSLMPLIAPAEPKFPDVSKVPLGDIAPPHSITLSARASRSGGRVQPSVFAVRALTTS